MRFSTFVSRFLKDGTLFMIELLWLLGAVEKTDVQFIG